MGKSQTKLPGGGELFLDFPSLPFPSLPFLFTSLSLSLFYPHGLRFFSFG